MRVKEIMSRNAACCSFADNLAKAAEMLWSHNCGTLPVVDDIGRVIGIVTDRDLCIALGTRDRKASELSVGNVMGKRLIECDPEVDVLSAMKMMQAERVRRLPIVDATGTLQGVLSMSDLIRHAGGNGGEIPGRDVIDTLKTICAPAAFAPSGQEEEHALASVA